MNMKKILLAGIAVGALASTSANAVSITSASVSGVTVTASGGVVTAPYGIPGNLTGVSASSPLSTTVTALANAIVVQSDGANGVPQQAVTYELYFKLSGSANPVYTNQGANAIGLANLTLTGVSGGTALANQAAKALAVTFGTCIVSDLNLNGGGSNQDNIAYRFTLTGICDKDNNVKSFRVDAPFQVRAVGDVVLKTDIITPSLGGGSTDSSGARTTTLVTTVSNYTDIGIGANPYSTSTLAGFNQGLQLPTAWAAAGVGGLNSFTSYTTAVGTDLFIGSIKATYLAGPSLSTPVVNYYSDLAATALPALTPTLVLTANSDVFKASRPTVTARAGSTVAFTPATVNSANTVSTSVAPGVAAPALIAGDITLGAIANNNISITAPVTYSGVFSVAPPAGRVPAPASVSAALETTTVQGFRIDAPWFGGSNASTPSIVRLSNTGSAATGPVTLVLNNAKLASGSLTSATCSITTGVPATGELLIDTARVTGCFGNFIRGDLAITVQGAVNNLTAKMRVVSGSGDVSEQTLGNVSASTPVTN